MALIRSGKKKNSEMKRSVDGEEKSQEQKGGELLGLGGLVRFHIQLFT